MFFWDSVGNLTNAEIFHVQLKIKIHQTVHITKFAFKMLMAKVILVELTFPALLW